MWLAGEGWGGCNRDATVSEFLHVHDDGMQYVVCTKIRHPAMRWDFPNTHDSWACSVTVDRTFVGEAMAQVFCRPSRNAACSLPFAIVKCNGSQPGASARWGAVTV